MQPTQPGDVNPATGVEWRGTVQDLARAYATASDRADDFRLALTAALGMLTTALGIDERPSDPVLIAAAVERIKNGGTPATALTLARYWAAGLRSNRPAINGVDEPLAILLDQLAHDLGVLPVR